MQLPASWTDTPGNTDGSLYFGKHRQVLSPKVRNRDMIWNVISPKFTAFQGTDQGMLHSVKSILKVRICSLSFQHYNN